MKEDFRDIAAYRVGPLLWLADWILMFPLLFYFRFKSAKSLRLEYLGDRKQIEQDIKNGACFLTNHRDIVLDAAWLSMLLRIRYNIRPFIGMGNNLFGKWWIEGLARFNRVYVVRRGVRPHELLEKSRHLSTYLRMLREQKHSIWLAEREGRAKDSDDRAQGSVIKMLTMAYMAEVNENETDNHNKGRVFFEAVKALNICPVSLSYEFDPCDYLKAEEFQLKRDNPRWRKRGKDDLFSMKTGILGQKGRVVFRMTPSINPEIDQMLAQEPELLDAPINEQAQRICDLIDRHVWQGYELFERGEAFERYIDSRVNMVRCPNPDREFLRAKIVEMYNNPVKNHESSLVSGIV